MPEVLTDTLIPFEGPVTAGFPEWFAARKRDAWDRALALPAPVRTDSDWRFSSMKVTKLEELRHAQVTDRLAPAAPEVLCEKTAGRMVFINDTCVESEACEGVIWMTLQDALVQHPELIREHFMARQPALGSAKFLALHEAMVGNAVVCVIPKGVKPAHPFEIVRWHAGGGTVSFPHTLILAEENSTVEVVERFLSIDPLGEGLVCAVNDLVTRTGARISYTAVQELGQNMKAMLFNSTTLAKDASAAHLGVHLGGKTIRSESVSHLLGAGSRSDMLSVTTANGDREIDQRTLQDHRSPDTASDLLYKNVLDDQSRTIFSGLIKVEPGAHRTDAYQKVRNLFLSDEAEANSMPGLEILADEVKCSHGATSGEIDQAELFYLLSRGISEPAARSLIAVGFLAEVFGRLPDSVFLENLAEKLRRQMCR